MTAAALSAALWAASAWAGGPGTSVAPVFKLPVGVRPAAMGDTFVSVADDASASAWNPAGLAIVPRKSLDLMHYQLFESIDYEYMGYAQPMGERGGLGAHLLYVYTDPIDRTFEDGSGSFDPSRSGGTFRDSDMKLDLSGAYAPLEWLSLGGGADYFQDKVDKDTADGFMLDAGLLARPLPRLALGWSLQNLGPAVRGGARPPALTRLGASWRPWAGGLLAAGYHYEFDSDRRVYSLGAEHVFFGAAALRLGFRWGDTQDAGGNTYTLGLGYLLGAWHFDYAFSPMGELGDTHRFGLGFSFGDERGGGDAPFAARAREPEAAEEDAPVLRGRAAAEDDLRQAAELIARGRTEAARRQLDAAAAILPEDDALMVRFHDLSGQADLRDEDLAGSQGSFIKALSLARRLRLNGPTVADAYAGLGICLSRQGRKDKARQALRKALGSGATNETRQAALRELERLKEPAP